MKKLALLILGILLGFLLCYFFFGKQDEAYDPGADPKPPTGYIDSNDMEALSDAYDGRHAIINKALGIDDNRSSWYSLADMRQFLDYAEFKASSGKHKMDGVRIYLGVNTSDGKNLTTMFLVPTSSSIQPKSTGSMFNLNFLAREGGGDIPGAGGLDYGGNGYPPGSGYPNPPQ